MPTATLSPTPTLCDGCNRLVDAEGDCSTCCRCTPHAGWQAPATAKAALPSFASRWTNAQIGV
jgi:hypothetical protein